MNWFVKKTLTPVVRINEVVDNSIFSEILSKKKFKNTNDLNEYLNCDLTSIYENTENMEGLHEAAKLLIKNKDKIIGIGNDFDVDGAFSTKILTSLMKLLGINYKVYSPDRIKDGYGLNRNAVNKALRDGCEIIVTVDNGISAFDAINYAKEKGLLVIVTDHHDLPVNKEGKVTLPNADIIINPKIGKYPFKYLCGAGVAYKLMIAVFKELNWDMDGLIEYLPYVAFATICDVVELIDENRIIVKHGLPLINKTNNKGLNALIRANELQNKKVLSVHSIGFILGPCINASGRLLSIDKAINLLETENEDEAISLANELVSLNETRKELTKTGLEECKKIINEFYANDKILVVYNENIHESIAGIIAGKIKDEFYRPTIILTNSSQDGIIKGSARSIDKYNIINNLSIAQSLLVSYGGHSKAAGLSLNINNLDILRKTLNHNCTLKKDDLIPSLTIDAIINNLNSIDLELAEHITYLEPFGAANPKPMFGSRSLTLKEIKPMGEDGKHFKLTCIKNNVYQNFILFYKADELLNKLKEKENEKEINNIFRGKGTVTVDLIYSISINDFNNRQYVQAIVEDFRF